MPFRNSSPPPTRAACGAWSASRARAKTFAMQIRGPLLCIDADHRADEVARLAAAGVYQLSDRPADNVAAEAIADCLRANMAGSDIKTILVDSLTAIMAPLVTAAILDNEAGRNKNRMTGFKDKALAMRLCRTASAPGAPMCSTSTTCRAAATPTPRRSPRRPSAAPSSPACNAASTSSSGLSIREGQAGIHVDWARRGRADLTLWDDTGIWKGMPEKIEQAIYGGLTEADQLKHLRRRPRPVSRTSKRPSPGGSSRGCSR